VWAAFWFLQYRTPPDRLFSSPQRRLNDLHTIQLCKKVRNKYQNVRKTILKKKETEKFLNIDGEWLDFCVPCSLAIHFDLTSQVLRVFAINLFSQLASFVWWVQNLIVEDWEVKGQTQTDGMCWLHFTLANVKCILVSGLRVIDNGCVCKNICLFGL